jgi:hypothetical protein
MNSTTKITIPIRVDTAFHENLGLWDVLDAVDERYSKSLGTINSYGFQNTVDFTDKIMTGVLEALLEGESLDSTTLYQVDLKIYEGDKELKSISQTFWGHTPPVIPNNWRLEYKTDVFEFLPYEDRNREIIESPHDYADRVHSTTLPNFPKEVLIEWFHRHPNVIEEYASLNFPALRFNLEDWPLKNIPGPEAFASKKSCAALAKSFKQRLLDGDWLATYMNQHDTWNTPILLLDNRNGDFPSVAGGPGRQPFHLLEGHTRLSFLIALRELGRASKRHKVYLVLRT